MMNGSQCYPHLRLSHYYARGEYVLVCNLIDTYTQIKEFDSFTFNGRKKCIRYLDVLFYYYFLMKEKKKKSLYLDS